MYPAYYLLQNSIFKGYCSLGLWWLEEHGRFTVGIRFLDQKCCSLFQSAESSRWIFQAGDALGHRQGLVSLLASRQSRFLLAGHQPWLLWPHPDLHQPLRRPVPQLLPGVIGWDSRQVVLALQIWEAKLSRLDVLILSSQSQRHLPWIGNWKCLVQKEFKRRLSLGLNYPNQYPTLSYLFSFVRFMPKLADPVITWFWHLKVNRHELNSKSKFWGCYFYCKATTVSPLL